MKKINPIISWWVTPKLPFPDIYEIPLLKNKSKIAYITFFFSQWFIHPIKRRLAKWYLRFLQNTTEIKVVGVTGSAGKSITVQLISSILRQKGKTVCTQTSVDSVYNIPNTILKCSPGTKFLVLEMSVEYLGEMDFYLWLAKPDIGVVTNVFPTHTEFFGDEKGVAKEKQKLIVNLPSNGFAVLNPTNKFTKNMAKLTKAKVFFFEANEDPIIQNSNTARKAAEILKVPNDLIDKGLNHYENPKHRLFQFKHKSGSIILDDTYNSNPEATLSTLKVFNKLAGNNKKITVLGDMLELGKLEEKEHRRVGREVLKSNFDVVIGVGSLSKYLIDEVKNSNCKTFLVDYQEKVLPILLPLLSKNTYVLIKGSRSIGLDKVIDKLV